MRRALVLAAVALLLAGCRGEPESLGSMVYAYDPVCDLGPITVDGVTYQVVQASHVGEYTPAPEPTMGAYARDGALERFDDGTATWTGNGYVVHLDANAAEGKYQVC